MTKTSQKAARAQRANQPHVTSENLEKLQGVIDSAFDRDRDVADALDSELSRAIVVDSSAVAPNVVTMNSKVVYENVATGDSREVTLVYPTRANATDGRISVLAPLGAALLGLAVGDEIHWPVSAGKELHLKVRDVTYQPEAAGEVGA